MEKAKGGFISLQNEVYILKQKLFNIERKSSICTEDLITISSELDDLIIKYGGVAKD